MPRKAKSVSAATADGEAAPPPLTGLTDTEMRFIKAVFDNMTQKPDANWDNVATDLGLKDAKCAKERFRQMSVRHGWRDQANGNGSPRKGGATGGSVSKRAPRTPTKKTVKSAALVEREEDEDGDGTVKGELDMETQMQVKMEAGDGDGLGAGAEI
ncbi:hypothetical protein E4U55_006475 [Claviceps digitariae]|nr:hypothetical protein E4U55_006475 [Claviceps digitariae]